MSQGIGNVLSPKGNSTMKCVKIAAVVSVFVMTGCQATFAKSVRDDVEGSRAFVAGDTLECAGIAQQKAVALAFTSVGLTTLGGVAFNMMLLSPSPELAIMTALAGIGLHSAAIVAVTAAWLHFNVAGQYNERAGQVLAGTSGIGGCSDEDKRKFFERPQVSAPSGRREKKDKKDGYGW